MGRLCIQTHPFGLTFRFTFWPTSLTSLTGYTLLVPCLCRGRVRDTSSACRMQCARVLYRSALGKEEMYDERR